MKWILGTSVLALTLGWAGTATIPAATITPDESILKYFPAETEGIAFIDAAALRGAPLVQSALDQGRFQSLPPAVNEFVESTGFDPRRDLDRITIGKIGPRERLVVAEVRYDRFKAEQFLKDKGKEPEIYLGRAVYTDGKGAVSFLDNIVFFGSESAVKQGLDRITYPTSVQVNADLLDGIRSIEAGNQVWAVGNFSQEDIAVDLPPGLPGQIFRSLRRGTYQMKIDRDVHARAMGTFADADTARNLADTARGLIAIGKLKVAQQQPDLLQVLDGIRVSSSGMSVTAQIDEPGDLLLKLKKK